MRFIMDVGMHRGEDTRFYLDKGFRVVAVEARADFVEENKEKFAPEVRDGRLEIVHCAIAEKEGNIPFTIFPDVSVWGTIDPRYAERNEKLGLRSETVEVPALRFDTLLGRFGIPHYIKIDIEGADLLCVEALQKFEERPPFVSVELTMSSFDDAFTAIAHLYVAGYRRFKIVNQQMNTKRRAPAPPREGKYVDVRFQHGASGFFGEESPGAWRSVEQTIGDLRHLFWLISMFSPEGRLKRFGRIYSGIARRTGGEPLAWWDLHAAL